MERRVTSGDEAVQKKGNTIILLYPSESAGMTYEAVIINRGGIACSEILLIKQ